jgi:hypothetical protein
MQAQTGAFQFFTLESFAMRITAMRRAGQWSRCAWVFWAGFLWPMCTASGNAQDISVPAKVQGDPGAFIVVQAQTKGDVVKWYCATPGLSMIPPALLKDSKTVVLMASKPGTYTLICWTALNGQPTDHACCQIVVGQPPEPPTPTPGPTPPAYLVEALTQALNKDGKSAQNLDSCKKIAAVARILAEKSKSDTTLKITGDVYTLWSQAVKNLVQPNDIPQIRAAIGAYLNAHLPTQVDAPLDANTRQQVATEFLMVATVLEGLQ